GHIQSSGGVHQPKQHNHSAIAVGRIRRKAVFLTQRIENQHWKGRRSARRPFFCCVEDMGILRCTILPVGGGDEKQSAERAAAGDRVLERGGGARTPGTNATRVNEKESGWDCESVRKISGTAGDGTGKYLDHSPAADCACAGSGSGKAGKGEEWGRAGDGR